MNRILLHVSYIGTAFNGVTFIEPYYKFRDLRTVQGVLEKAVKSYFKERCEVSCSSRTDARVHALASTFHTDVKLNIMPNKHDLIAALNINLKLARAAIRINDAELVDSTNFMAYRNVENRTYLYRIAVKPKGKPGEFSVPIEEVDRCFFIESNTFEIDKLREASKLFIGKHDFRSFMRYSKEEKTKDANYGQRKIFSISIEESMPCVISSTKTPFKFYDITFTANSYVYRQIRRIVGSLCAFAEGQINERDIYELLTIPSNSTWHSLCDRNLVDTAPGCGLYFVGISYKSEENRSLSMAPHTPRGIRIKSFVN